MKPIRKPFVGNALFPVELTYHTLRTQNDELPDHLHDRYELVYIHRGQGVFFIDHAWYEKKRGDLFLIPGNTIHHSLPRDEDPIVSSALFFAPSLLPVSSFEPNYDPLLAFDFARKKRTYRIELPEALIEEVELALFHMQQEILEEQIGFQESVKQLVGQLMLKINRFILSEKGFDPSKAAGVGPSWINEALRKIDQNPEAEHGLTQLAQTANVSPPHFSRVFKQLTTMNLTQYINAKRMIRAKELLTHTEMTIEEIARHSGYDTSTHFYRVFKALTGSTPKKYRTPKNEKNEVSSQQKARLHEYG